jgi:hypothetical protein
MGRVAIMILMVQLKSDGTFDTLELPFWRRPTPTLMSTLFLSTSSAIFAVPLSRGMARKKESGYTFPDVQNFRKHMVTPECFWIRRKNSLFL